jgi:hypothetical protein
MHKINVTLVFFLIFTIVSSALAYKIVTSAYSSYDNNYDENHLLRKMPDADKSDPIKVYFPKPNVIVESPMVVKGEAKGSWYFEASFPVRLYDANNKEIPLTPGYIMTTEDWMTTAFVPFEATISFEKPETSTGTLVLHNDNPSGLLEYDASVSIPVKFE